MSNDFIESIRARKAVIGVIGLGYVGLPLGLCFTEKGFKVYGFDVDERKVDSLNKGTSYIKHIAAERVERGIKAGFSATAEFSKLSACSAILIAVPTPLTKQREPDMAYVVSTCETISKYLVKGQLVVLESTTYPGTTAEVMVPLLEKSGLKAGRDFQVAFSPEREDPNNPQYTTETIPKVVGADAPEGLAMAKALYSQIVVSVIPVSSTRVAEATKLMENIFRSVNIALVNELKVTFDKMGIDVWEVIEAAKTKPFGYMPFYPGPGLGGHCIPLDPFYLSWKAAEYGMWTRFIELAGEVNTHMPRYVVERTTHALNHESKAVKGARVLVLGLAYKANIDDDRKSPSYEIIELFQEKGAQVSYCDPYFPRARKGRKHDLALASIPCTAEAFAHHDAVVVATAHEAFKDRRLYRDVSLVVDTRNIIAPLLAEPGSGPRRLVKA